MAQIQFYCNQVYKNKYTAYKLFQISIFLNTFSIKVVTIRHVDIRNGKNYTFAFWFYILLQEKL